MIKLCSQGLGYALPVTLTSNCNLAIVSGGYDQLAMLMFRSCNSACLPAKQPIWKPPTPKL